MLRHNALRTVPLLILVNKQDADGAVALERIVGRFLEATAALGDRDCRIQPLVALQGYKQTGLTGWDGCALAHSSRRRVRRRRTGVREGVTWLLRCMQRNADQRPPKLES
jgi:hypothetical protein